MNPDLRMLLRLYDNAGTEGQHNDAFMSALRRLIVEATQSEQPSCDPTPAKDYRWGFTEEAAQ